MRVSSNAGEQYLTGRDDVVESEVRIPLSAMGDLMFTAFSGAMEKLEKLASLLYGAVGAYHSAMKITDKDIVAESVGHFWQLAEHTVHELLDACDPHHEGWTEDILPALMSRYRVMILSVYDEACPHDTARQFETWVRNRPFSGRKHG